jgi:hypothetical protein
MLGIFNPRKTKHFGLTNRFIANKNKFETKFIHPCSRSRVFRVITKFAFIFPFLNSIASIRTSAGEGARNFCQLTASSCYYSIWLVLELKVEEASDFVDVSSCNYPVVQFHC